MSSRLCKIPFGTGKPDKLFDIDTDLVIRNFCHIDRFGFLFLFSDNHFIGFSDFKGHIVLPWMGEIDVTGNEDGTAPLFEYPSSICYFPASKSCYIIERGGLQIRHIEISSKYCSSMLLSDSIGKYFSKFDGNKSETSCDVDVSGNIYWVVKGMHRGFRMNRDNNSATDYIGSGHPGFSVSNNLHFCLLSSPYGIKCIDGCIYISDTNNHCVRAIKDKAISIVMGHPLNSEILNTPSQLKLDANIMYVLDGHDIKYLSLKDKNIGKIYSSDNIIAFECNKKELYVLEKV